MLAERRIRVARITLHPAQSYLVEGGGKCFKTI